jgi:hypothetical protein
MVMTVNQTGYQQELIPTDFLGLGVFACNLIIGANILNGFARNRNGTVPYGRLIVCGH